MIEFEWDLSKARLNLRKHGVTFKQAATVFRDPLSIAFDDPDHSEEEDLYIIIGLSDAGRLLMVSCKPRQPYPAHQCLGAYPFGA